MRTLVSVVLGSILCVLAVCGVAAAAQAPLSTGDGTWQWRWPLPQGNGLSAVAFSDGSAGWAVGDAGTLLSTTDGGATWVSHAAATRADLNAVDFAGTATGWAVGDGGVAVRTTDGGRTWVAATLQADDLLDVSFVSATTGWALGRRDDPGEATGPTSVLFHTTDGGTTWTAQKTWTATRLRAVGFADEKASWLVGDGARIEHTSDGGATWTTQTVDTGLALETLCVVDASTVRAAGEIVMKTSDGGATWESRSNSDVYADTFSGIAAGSDGHVVAVGRFNPDEEGSHVCAVIASSADGGASWRTHYDADYVDGAFTAVAFGAGSGVCVVGSTGAVVRSGDGGDTWTGREPRGARRSSRRARGARRSTPSTSRTPGPATRSAMPASC